MPLPLKHLPATLLLLAPLFASGCHAPQPQSLAASKPNIVYILADDLGYGDVHCLGGARAKIATPNLDRLAKGGMIFTEAHSSSAVCTPSRYSIMTGRYAWRTHLQSAVLGGYSPALIAEGRLTVPALLKQQGYDTACIGKWHLGMDIAKDPAATTIENGPLTRGFDHYFGISASLDMPPYAFIDGDRFTEAPSVEKSFPSGKASSPHQGRKGAAAPSFEAVDVLPALAGKAVAHIGKRAKAGQPFFLYMPLNSPHTPIVPSKAWQGKSGLGDYGDFVMETDWAVGKVLAALDQNGLAGNTLVIFTSDNGCSPSADIPELEKAGHFPSELRRGEKSDIWDGGHRIPFIVRWPGRVKAGSQSGQTICQSDLMATCADITGAKLPDNAAEDSVSLLPALDGTADKPLREAVIHHSIRGAFAIRQGRWKLELCRGSGGWSKGGDGESTQLYDMDQDVGERANVCKDHPEIVRQLTALLEKQIADGRSTPGAPQKNDAKIVVRKKGADQVSK